MTSTATAVFSPLTTTDREPTSPHPGSSPSKQPLWHRVLAAVGVAVLVTFGGGTEALAVAKGGLANATLTQVSDPGRTGARPSSA